MATVTATQTAGSAPVKPLAADPVRRIHRFSVKQYHRMIEEGILTEDDRVELLDGMVVAKMTHKPPHDAAISLAQKAFLRHLSEEWIVRIQSAVTMPGDFALSGIGSISAFAGSLPCCFL